MRYKTKRKSVVQHAEFAIYGDDVIAVITDERGLIMAWLVIATVYDQNERLELYWALRRALEGETTEVINDEE